MNNDKSHKYELWRPVVRLDQRAALEAMHRELATLWREALLQFGIDARFDLQGSGIGAFARLRDERPAAPQVTVFTVGSLRAPALMMLSPELGRALVDKHLGGTGDREREFTPIEREILRQMGDVMFDVLRQAYARRGIGEISSPRQAAGLTELQGFEDGEYLIVFTFAGSGGNLEGEVSVALSAGVANAIVESRNSARTSSRSGAVRAQVGNLPLAAEVVLGEWRVSVGEVLDLKPGDEIPLPDLHEGTLAISRGPALPAQIHLRPQGLLLVMQPKFEQHGQG